MTTNTIAERIAKLMTFYAAYSKNADLIFDGAEEDKDSVRYKRDLYGRWITEELEELKALGIDVDGFGYLAN